MTKPERTDAIIERVDEIVSQLRKIKRKAVIGKPFGEVELNTIGDVMSSLAHQVRMFNSEDDDPK